jgi:hypothetical protein
MKDNDELEIDDKEILNWIDSKPQRLRRKVKYALRFIMIPFYMVFMTFLLILSLIKRVIKRG